MEIFLSLKHNIYQRNSKDPEKSLAQDSDMCCVLVLGGVGMSLPEASVSQRYTIDTAEMLELQKVLYR